MIRFAPKYVRTTLVLALLLFAVSVHTAEATHFLGGKITWSKDPVYSSTHPGQTKIDFKFQASWRWSFDWGGVGGSGFPPLNSVPTFQYPLVLRDALGASQTLSVAQRVAQIQSTDDWFIGEYLFSVIFQDTQFPVTVHYTACCRSSALKEGNNDRDWVLHLVVDPTKGTRSPDSTLLPRITLPQNIPSNFQIPTIAYDGLTNRVTIAPPGSPDVLQTTSGLLTARPVSSPLCTGPNCSVCTNLPGPSGFCNAALTVSQTGLVSWTPQVLGLYAVQFTITSVDSNGVLKNAIPLDFLIEVEAPCNPADPGCNTPPTIAPLPPSVSATAGKQLSLNVSASDLQVAQIVTVASSALPSGATFTALTNPPGHNMLYRLLWTPTNAQVGDHVVCFQAYDNAGGTSVGQVCTTIHVAPSPPPSLVCNAVPAIQADHNGVVGLVLSGATFDPDGTAVSVLLKNGATTIGSATIPAGTLSLAPFSATSNFPQGTTTVVVTATDTVGSSSTCNIVVTVDRQSQSITFTGLDPVSYALNAHVAFNGVASSGLPVSYQVVSGPGAIVGGQLELHGVGVIEVRASQGGDPDYAPATDVNAFFHVVDVTSPVIAGHGPVSAEATSPAGAAIDYGVVGFTDDVDGSGSATCVPSTGSTFPVGTTPVNCHAQDAAGNGSDSTFSVTVTDTTAPAIGTNSNVVAEATGPGGAAVIFASPSASDLVDTSVAVVCVPASGSTFGLTTTPVTCTATDDYGNHSSSLFTVTVQDTTAPVVTYSGNAGTYTIGQTVNITCSASDAVGVVSSTCANISGPAYSFAASNTFSATATDAAGHVGSGSASFTVTTSLQGLLDLVNTFCNNPGVCQGLNAKLTAAANAPNANARKGQLGAFDNQVAAQTGKCMTAEQAAILLQLVHAFFN